MTQSAPMDKIEFLDSFGWEIEHPRRLTIIANTMIEGSGKYVQSHAQIVSETNADKLVIIEPRAPYDDSILTAGGTALIGGGTSPIYKYSQPYSFDEHLISMVAPFASVSIEF